MTRSITTAADLDALPVGSVVLGAAYPDEPRRPLGERISHRLDPDARWNVDGRHYYGATETVLAVLGGAATVLHDPSAPAPVVSDAAVEAGVAAGKERLTWPSLHWSASRLDPEAWPHVVRAILDAALPFLGAAPSATREDVEDTLVMTRLSDYAGSDMAVIGQTADALLARFTITPRTDR